MSGLKLIAMEPKDLAVVSAQVQDALTRPDAIDFSARSGRFLLAINRFAWDAAGSRRSYERRQAVLTFSRVTGVKTKGIRRGDDRQVLSLMAVRFVPGDAPSGTVHLVFADGAEIHLAVECLEVLLEDTGAAWETRFKPRHPLA